MATIQQSDTVHKGETASDSVTWVASHGSVASLHMSISGRNATFQRMPVTRRQDGTMLFDPAAMMSLTPYRFNFLGHDMAVVKSQKGDLDFFYFPNSPDEASECMIPVRADETEQE